MADDSHRGRDQAWIEQVWLGDEAAFEALFRTYFAELCRYAKQYVGSADLSEDVVQTVFIRVWESRQKNWVARGTVRSYLYHAVKNQALKVVRSRRSIIQRHERALRGNDRPWSEPRDNAEIAELAAIVRRAIDEFPERRRLIFTLKRQNGLTYKEIAALLDISVSTVSTQMRRALETLRRRISQYRS